MMSDATIKAAARTFAEKLRRSEPIAAFWQAKARLEADHQAQELLAKLSERQRALALKQQAGQITQSDSTEKRAPWMQLPLLLVALARVVPLHAVVIALKATFLQTSRKAISLICAGCSSKPRVTRLSGPTSGPCSRPSSSCPR